MYTWITKKSELDVSGRLKRTWIAEHRTYNHDQSLQEKTLYLPNGDVEQRITYRYFPNGDLQESVEYDAFSQVLIRQTYFINEDGDLIRHHIAYGDGSKEIKRFAFSDFGNVDEATVEDENGNVIGREVFVMDDQNRLIEEIVYGEDGEESEKVQYAYNDADEVIREAIYIDGNLERVSTSEVNEVGVKIVTTMDADGNAIKVTHNTLDEQGRLLKEHVENLLWESTKLTENTYDEHGNQILNTVMRDGQLVFKNECTYDQDQNLIREEVMEVGNYTTPHCHEIYEHEKREG